MPCILDVSIPSPLPPPPFLTPKQYSISIQTLWVLLVTYKFQLVLPICAPVCGHTHGAWATYPKPLTTQRKVAFPTPGATNCH